MAMFEKSSAAPGKQRRIAGIVALEVPDRVGETLIQKGLDFSEFLSGGWYNDDHKKGTEDLLGWPDPSALRSFQKGEILPDGTVAEANGTWAEGWLLDTPRAQAVWEVGQALAKAGSDRRLGYSVEGKILRREGRDGKIIAKAKVSNIAITPRPTGHGVRLECLAKSMALVEDGMTVEKALTMTGAGAAPAGTNPSAQGPTAGEGAGRIIAPASVETDDEDKKKLKVLTKGEVYGALLARFPYASIDSLERAYRLLNTLSSQGTLR